MPGDDDIERLLTARHGDPFAVLGPHARGAGWEVCCLLPGATRVDVVGAGPDGPALAATSCLHPDGLFLASGTGVPPRDYRLRATWADGQVSTVDDPYRFPPVLGELDGWLLAEGTHRRPHEALGARPRRLLDVDGTAFAVWAPNASRVSVVGDFNGWDGRRHAMRLRRECGVWELFVPGVATGVRYKYELVDASGYLLPLKADPFAMAAELRPATASIVAEMPPRQPGTEARRQANALDAPVSVYEVHLASWRRADGDRWLDWDALADQLVGYAVDLGFTHLELLPISEHPFDGSWGYQPIGLYAPTARHGDAAGLRRFVERAHAAGIGVLLDWVPAHFPSDPHGLARFDGTALYEHADPREGFHQDWNTLIYNFGRTEVRNFLIGNALYWLEHYGFDGLRVDAVASMLYRDYSRRDGEWVPNVHGGRENLEAIAFLRGMNEVVGTERPQAVTVAEESTAFPKVSRPPYVGGLGFHYKWNLGWMHDTLAYLARDPIHRRWHHHEMTFAMSYAANENYVLPLSHDEVVHGKGSLIGKMPGDRWQRFATLRALYGWMWAHPGKKLLFMGGEFAQEREWSHERSLDWHLLGDPLHAGVQQLVRDLNRRLRDTPALHQQDFGPEGYTWIDGADQERSIFSFLRRGRDDGQWLVAVSHFTPQVHAEVRIGVPAPGRWRELLNTDSAYYGGGNVGQPMGVVDSEAVPWHGHAQSVRLTVPPLATLWLAPAP